MKVGCTLRGHCWLDDWITMKSKQMWIYTNEMMIICTLNFGYGQSMNSSQRFFSFQTQGMFSQIYSCLHLVVKLFVVCHGKGNRTVYMRCDNAESQIQIQCKDDHQIMRRIRSKLSADDIDNFVWHWSCEPDQSLVIKTIAFKLADEWTRW